MEGDVRSRLRILALAALLALALGVAACGDSDDDDGGNGGSDANAAAKQEDGVDPASFDNTPDGQVRLAYAQFVDAFYDKDARTSCGFMTAKTKREVAAGAKSCEVGLESYFESGSTLVKDRPRIVKLTVNGSRAVAITQVKGSARYPVPFVKQGGEWKIAGGWSPA